MQPGEPIAIPIEFGPRSDPRDIVRVGLDNRFVLVSEVFLIRVERLPAAATPLGRWLGITERWSSVHNELVPRNTGEVRDGFWIVKVDLPEQPTELRGTISIDGTPLRTVWVDRGSLSLPLPSQAAARSAGAVASLASEPRERWRWLLASGTLAEPRATPIDEGPLEAIARDRERRIALALSLLARADSPLASRVIDRLVRTVRFDRTIVVPAWTPEGAELAGLIDLLLATDATDRSRIAAAELWLQREPPMLARLVGDAGRVGSDRQPIGAASITNLTADPVVLAVQRSGDQPVPVAVEPFATERVELVGPATGLSSVMLIDGDRTDSIGVMAGSVRVVPPGLLAGPTAVDLTLATWFTGVDETGDTAARIEPLPRGQARVRSWQAVIECSGATGPDDRVELWLGSRDRRTPMVVRVWSDGRAEDSGGSPLRGVTVIREQDRWLAIVPIPERAIEPGRRLRLGLLRDRGAAGPREAWPRALKPWERQPGRILLDLSAWDDPISGPATR